MKMSDFESFKATIEVFLQKENSTLVKYDLITKKIWLTTGKQEPQAGEFVKILKHLIDSLTNSEGWKILYKLKEP